MIDQHIINAIQLMKDSPDLFKVLYINIRKECKAYISNKIQEFHNSNDELLELGQFLFTRIKHIKAKLYTLYFNNQEYMDNLFYSESSFSFYTMEQCKYVNDLLVTVYPINISSIFNEFNKLYNKYLL
jgi:hypothetical protein